MQMACSSSSWILTRPLRAVSHRLDLLLRRSEAEPIRSSHTFRIPRSRLMSEQSLQDQHANRQNLGLVDARASVSSVGAEDHADHSSWVAILLCSMHGQHFIAEQLESIMAQTHARWTVWVSDDGSEDDTHQIINLYLAKWGPDRISIRPGPSKGYAANFLSLTRQEIIQARYYAYADQDDVWEPDKLSRAVEWLNTVPADIPALYCSRTRLIDQQGREIGFSPLIRWPPSFANALVQNISGGNTIVFNEATRNLLREIPEDIGIVAHDWLAYQLVTGCGGRVHFDPYPSVRYRQHCSNLIGSKNGWRNKLWRMKRFLGGQFRHWNDVNIQALRGIFRKLTPDNQRTLDHFSAARNRSLIPRIVGIWRSGVHRQSFLENLGLCVGVLVKRV